MNDSVLYTLFLTLILFCDRMSQLCLTWDKPKKSLDNLYLLNSDMG